MCAKYVATGEAFYKEKKCDTLTEAIYRALYETGDNCERKQILADEELVYDSNAEGSLVKWVKAERPELEHLIRD